MPLSVVWALELDMDEHERDRLPQKSLAVNFDTDVNPALMPNLRLLVGNPDRLNEKAPTHGNTRDGSRLSDADRSS